MISVVILAQVLLQSFYGLGGAVTSPGVVAITQQATAIPGVKAAPISYYDQWPQTVSPIEALSASTKVILFGYSCGVGSTAQVANAVYPRKVYLVAIQGSVYCPPPTSKSNIAFAQETYNPSFLMTLGLGWKWYSGTPVHLIPRYDFHPYADIDPATQNDVLGFISAVAKGQI